MKYKICPTCKKKFLWQGESKKYWKERKYCSIKCSGTLIKKGSIPWNKGKPGKIGKESPSFRGGRNIATNGYVRILIPGTSSYQFEHRLVIEKHLGRKLKRTEVVHHKNGNRQDNRIENLEIMIKQKHDSYETQKRWDDKTKPFRSNLKSGGF